MPTAVSEPSPQLIQSLISLSKAVQDLGIFRDVPRYYNVAETTLHRLVTELAGHSWDVDDMQALQDLLLLRRLAELQSWNDICALLDERIKAIEAKVIDLVLITFVNLSHPGSIFGCNIRH